MKDLLKKEITTAILSKNILKRDILKVVLGEVQTIESRQGVISDEQVIKIIKKLIQSNNECIALVKNEKLEQENVILGAFLPKEMTLAELGGFFLGMGGYQHIVEAKNEGQAVGLVMKAVKAASLSVDSSVVKEFVQKVRKVS